MESTGCRGWKTKPESNKARVFRHKEVIRVEAIGREGGGDRKRGWSVGWAQREKERREKRDGIPTLQTLRGRKSSTGEYRQEKRRAMSRSAKEQLFVCR
ncbi:uncharacterized protein BO66DRAFT_389446 [Aspergillus aculeatinus CBS 121060]|uniref:Uncharacterized protein n=1 Tax=Aspergillus aculeatinus CBS 121060 TaxID=1448322 RepID=A0ACD1HGU9_9EURO|nr:hypothetical protein BO66DRAFT_389446 [Aspergillus aculeatinus CBS 121060]RAH72873.1 hypothetical protein BO66DRAFT_389446 [Aspergillus aculeatinus CBS 121060]